ncbi:MAG: tol-pal system protein YbgF [Motiliproteus sp.]
MSRLTTASVALLLGLFFESAIAQDGIPVEDRSNQNSATGNSAASTPVFVAPVAPSSASAAPAPRPTTTSSSNAALGELLMMLDQLQEEVGMLRGQVEQQQHQLKKMQVDQRDRYRDLDRRLSLLNQQTYSAPATALPLTSLVEPASVGSGASATAASSTSSTPLVIVPPVAASSPTVSDSQAFKDAFALVRKSRFDQALTAFEQFLITYPQSTLTANVLYWTGEVHRAQSNPDLEKASFAYLQVIERYPNNAKVADAYYKLGLCYQGLKQTEKAKATMNKLIELFPDQVTAELARDFLKQQR